MMASYQAIIKENNKWWQSAVVATKRKIKIKNIFKLDVEIKINELK